MNSRKRRLASLFILGVLLVTLPIAIWAIIKGGGIDLKFNTSNNKEASAAIASASPASSPLPTDESTSDTCAHTKPNLSITPIVQVGESGRTLTYNVFFQNMDSDCPPTTFTFTTQVNDGWNAQITPAQVQFSNGGSMNTTLTVTSPTGAANSIYPVGISVSSNYPVHYQSVTVSYQVLNPSPSPNP